MLEERTEGWVAALQSATAVQATETDHDNEQLT